MDLSVIRIGHVGHLGNRNRLSNVHNSILAVPNRPRYMVRNPRNWRQSTSYLHQAILVIWELNDSSLIDGGVSEFTYSHHAIPEYVVYVGILHRSLQVADNSKKKFSLFKTN